MNSQWLVQRVNSARFSRTCNIWQPPRLWSIHQRNEGVALQTKQCCLHQHHNNDKVIPATGKQQPKRAERMHSRQAGTEPRTSPAPLSASFDLSLADMSCCLGLTSTTLPLLCCLHAYLLTNLTHFSTPPPLLVMLLTLRALHSNYSMARGCQAPWKQAFGRRKSCQRLATTGLTTVITCHTEHESSSTSAAWQAAPQSSSPVPHTYTLKAYCV